jgi:hypothetical protein
MINPLKFRAWHKEYKEMYCNINILVKYPDGWCVHVIDIKVDGTSCFEPNKIELMQWIGLHDITNKEIYEGDILTYNYGGGIETYLIERNPHDKQLQVRYIYAPGYNVDYIGMTPLERSTIVGNIYENSELLENEDLIDGK